jgi:hypothetical protein
MPCVGFAVSLTITMTLLRLAAPVTAGSQAECTTVAGNLVIGCGFESPDSGYYAVTLRDPFPDASSEPWIPGPNGVEEAGPHGMRRTAGNRHLI